MIGMKFTKAAEIVFVELGAILVAVESNQPWRHRPDSRVSSRFAGRPSRGSRRSAETFATCDTSRSGEDVELWPVGYQIQPGDFAIMICSHQNTATKVRQPQRSP